MTPQIAGPGQPGSSNPDWQTPATPIRFGGIYAVSALESPSRQSISDMGSPFDSWMAQSGFEKRDSREGELAFLFRSPVRPLVVSPITRDRTISMRRYCLAMGCSRVVE